jgi:hypothetical protein
MGSIRIKVIDYLVIAALLLWGVAGFWLNWQAASAAGPKYARILVQNRQVTELSLTPGDRFDYTLYFGENNQHSAVIEIDDGRIRMLPLSEELCPRAVCSHTGWIEYSYESIVCLPNQIVVVFSDSSRPGEAEGIDSVTY